MGRDISVLRVEKKPNAPKLVPNGVSDDTSDVPPKSSGVSSEGNDHVVGDHNAENSIAEECQQKQDVLGVKSTNHNVALSDGNTMKPEVQKASEKNFRSPVKGKVQTKNAVPHLSTLEPQMQVSTETYPVGAKTVDACGNSSSNSNDLHSPSSAKKSQPSSPQVSRKPYQLYHKKYRDEEDNWSVASSTTSVRTAKFRTTVPVAPVFKSVARAHRRKEFYTKLGEKQQALEAKKMEYAARTKEDEEAAIKQLRKNMAYKANPVPSFYQEGPPPKAALKKLPLTRPKSPNLTRRKSCGDAAAGSGSVEKAVCTRAVRHSLGNHKEHSCSITSPLKKKDQTNGRSGKEHPRTGKDTANKTIQKIVEQTADIAVNG